MQPCNARVANPPLKKFNNRVEEAKFSHTFASNSNSKRKHTSNSSIVMENAWQGINISTPHAAA
jgi:hypothetical protein